MRCSVGGWHIRLILVLQQPSHSATSSQWRIGPCSSATLAPNWSKSVIRPYVDPDPSVAFSASVASRIALYKFDYYYYYYYYYWRQNRFTPKIGCGVRGVFLIFFSSFSAPPVHHKKHGYSMYPETHFGAMVVSLKSVCRWDNFPTLAFQHINAMPTSLMHTNFSV